MKMVKEHYVSGYDAFVAFMDDLKENGHVNVYFSGSKDSNGKSWCPDCVVAEPHVRNGLKYAPEDSVFIYVDVGDRVTWKDMKCPFRTDKNTKLMVIPTLIRWKSPQRLEGAQLENGSLLEMFFTDE